MAYRVRRVGGLRGSNWRAVVFLTCDADSEINASEAFEKLLQKRRRELLDRFDHWIAGGVQDNYFHGWPNNPRYKNCFVFKLREKRLCSRFYGFLFHPIPNANPRFQVCVLCSKATKTEWETDPSELDGANVLRIKPQVIAAIRREFVDGREGQWLN